MTRLVTFDSAIRALKYAIAYSNNVRKKHWTTLEPYEHENAIWHAANLQFAIDRLRELQSVAQYEPTFWEGEYR